MAALRILLGRGTLVSALDERSRRALACGAMQPIQTVEETLRDAGVEFVVKRVASLARKQAEGARRDKPANPFLPHEPGLFVADVSDTHFALLNKFNVIERHLLVVTRRFVHQETLLDADDFAALAACMAEYESLGFYNGGVVAGASQPHKHLQLVPLPLAPSGPPAPVEALFETLRGRAGILRVPGLAFAHAFAWFDADEFADAARAAARLAPLYLALYAAAGLKPIEAGGEARQSAPYNLLLTRRWMLLVPRSREHFESISVNALGFAGSLFVRNQAERDAVRRAGPMRVLREVTLPA